MSNVDQERFPPQGALERVKRRADGNCFIGVCAVSSGINGVVALIAADVETLEIAWNDISAAPLDLGGVQRVAIFSQDALTPNAGVTGAERPC